MGGVHFGVGDYGKVCMWFSTDVGDCVALQVLSITDAVKLIEKEKVRHIDELNGRVCWVDDDTQMIRYLEPGGINN
jgi:hypothetical protein